MNKKTLLMGVLNITPDSFSDGGLYSEIEQIATQIKVLIDDGMDILDIGAESSRPNSTPITAEQEWERLLPVLNWLKEHHPKLTLSIDSYHSKTHIKCLNYNVSYINNIAGVMNGKDLEKIVKAKPGIKYIAMHMYKNPEQMQSKPLEAHNIIAIVDNFFCKSFEKLLNSGVKQENIWLDPGIGFGKNDRANAKLMLNIANWSKKYNIIIGVSRKSFIGRNLNIENPQDRDEASKMLEFGLCMLGAKIIRSHNLEYLKGLTNLLV